MNKVISIFIAAVIGGGIFGLVLNVLGGFENDFAADRQLSANITQITANPAAIDWKQLPPLEIQAASALLTKISANGQRNIIWEKGAKQTSPIASLTKLMTAVIAAEFYKQNQNITVTKRAIEQLDAAGFLKVGERLNLEVLLKIMLIESSNDAAFALTEPMGGPNAFVHLMNLKARDLGLNHSYFFNPSGLDPEDTNSPKEQINYSTANDLVILVQYIVYEHPEIAGILSEKELALYSDNGQFHHNLQNTNELLGQIPSVIWGKTGTTDKAGGCLLLVIRDKLPGTYLVAVVLNSPDKFSDMKKIIDNYGL